MHILNRPLAEDEPIPRNMFLSIGKLLEEGRIEEVKIIVGCLIDTGRLKTSLPWESYSWWAGDINQRILAGSALVGDLETSWGRFLRASNVMPMVRHFTNRIGTLIQGKHKNALVYFKRNTS